MVLLWYKTLDSQSGMPTYPLKCLMKGNRHRGSGTGTKDDKEPNENSSRQIHLRSRKRNGKSCIYKTDENHTVIISERRTAQICDSRFFHHDSTSR